MALHTVHAHRPLRRVCNCRRPRLLVYRWLPYKRRYPIEPISYWHLSHFEACGTPDWPAGVGGPHCEIFSSLRPKTVALTILVLIEMLNALNALSQNESLL